MKQPKKRPPSRHVARPFEGVLKPEVKRVKELKIELPIDVWEGIEKYGHAHMKGSSPEHVCKATILFFYENEIETAISASGPIALPSLEAVPDLKAASR